MKQNHPKSTLARSDIISIARELHLRSLVRNDRKGVVGEYVFGYMMNLLHKQKRSVPVAMVLEYSYNITSSVVAITGDSSEVSFAFMDVDEMTRCLGNLSEFINDFWKNE